MNTTTFYRIENELGEGPYRSSPCLENDCEFWNPTEKHPLPYRDSLLNENFFAVTDKTLNEITLEEFVFGFTSIEQFRSWFFDDRVVKWLHKNGFGLYCAEVSVVAGHSQALCSSEEWELAEKEKISLEDFYKK